MSRRSDGGRDPIGGRRLNGGIDPILGSLLDLAGNTLRLLLWLGRVSQTLGALRMYARQRINRMMADRAAFPLGIEERRVVVVVRGIHQDLLVYEHAAGCFDG